jgi:UDP-3-O-[3-hydroxymyristoyl] glucosamine N-acyltransferase
VVALSLRELARHTGAELHGDGDTLVTGVAPLGKAGAGSVTFFTNPRMRHLLAATGASAVILAPDDRAACPVAALVSPNPYATYARVAALLHPSAPGRCGIDAAASVSGSATVHSSAWIGPHCTVEAGAVIGARVQIGPGCYIGEKVVLGEDCRLVANVTLCSATRIGARALIHPGAVIGADGFGFANDEGVWIKIPQLGGVSIGDDVEIGANTTIDRGALEDTVIEHGVKLDNQIQIGHNCRIGAHTAIAGCAGIAGSANIGRACTIGGGAGIAGHIDIADKVHIAGMSAVASSIAEPGAYAGAPPLQTKSAWQRSLFRIKQLDELARRLKRLEAAVLRRAGDGPDRK